MSRQLVQGVPHLLPETGGLHLPQGSKCRVRGVRIWMDGWKTRFEIWSIQLPYKVRLIVRRQIALAVIVLARWKISIIGSRLRFLNFSDFDAKKYQKYEIFASSV